MGGGFELLRGFVVQRGVQPLAVVVLLDELWDVGAQMVEIAIVAGVDLLPLEGPEEALAGALS